MTGADRRAARRRKYLSLGLGELVAAGVFAAVLPRLVGPGDGRALWCALIPLLVVLTQAGCFWLLARTWVDRRPMPRAIATVYRGFRLADVVLLLAGLVGVLLYWPGTGRSAVVVLAVWLFAVVEYVNYFAVRLAYPVRRWSRRVREWRTPRLVQDLNAARWVRPDHDAGSRGD